MFSFLPRFTFTSRSSAWGVVILPRWIGFSEDIRTCLRTCGGRERPKQHFRTDQPAMHSRIGYFDCWSCEKKHQCYKKFLAQSLQQLWKEKTGVLLMLHATMIDYDSIQKAGQGELTGRVFQADAKGSGDSRLCQGRGSGHDTREVAEQV